MSLTDRELDQILAGGGRPDSLPTPQSTVEALMFELRTRGTAALANVKCRRRFAEISTAQLKTVIKRLKRLQRLKRIKRLRSEYAYVAVDNALVRQLSEQLA